MKYLLPFIFLMTACCHEIENGALSECLALKLEEFKKDPKAVSILRYKIKSEYHYWLNTDATHYDGVEYIINQKCDTVCYICGECFIPDCFQNYPKDKEQWELIWKK